MSIQSRRYRIIWEKIKRSPTRSVSLKVHPAFFARVVKAVKKEKDEDIAFKMMNDFDSFRLVITKDTAAGIITFTLKQRLGLQKMIVC